MLTIGNLYDLARTRYDEAKILLANHKPEGAVYLCGYALELMLKRHIVSILEWDGYPETDAEFKGLQSYKVHELDKLLKLAGLEKKIQADSGVFARWQIAKRWNSEIRYQVIGKTTESEAHETIEQTRRTINFIIKHSNP